MLAVVEPRVVRQGSKPRKAREVGRRRLKAHKCRPIPQVAPLGWKEWRSLRRQRGNALGMKGVHGARCRQCKVREAHSTRVGLRRLNQRKEPLARESTLLGRLASHKQRVRCAGRDDEARIRVWQALDAREWRRVVARANKSDRTQKDWVFTGDFYVFRCRWLGNIRTYR